jgi:hypothetical protein
MTILASALTLLVCQVPGSPAPAGGDVIRLDVGTELEGTIRKETDDYVEIELADGSVIGLDKKRAVAIVRSAVARASAADVRPSDALAKGPEDRWFTLHDGHGERVGWLHATVAPAEDGSLRIGEEWSFDGGDATTEVTRLEVVDADGRPRSCFYHERVRTAGAGESRVTSQRVVRGVVDAGRLEVVSRSTAGGPSATHQTYEFPDGARFPLEARAQLRRSGAPARAEITHRVFDPGSATWTSTTWEVGRQRAVEWNGSRIIVRELVEADGRGRNAEWLDGAAGTLRREINGPALVATAADQATATAARATAPARREPAFAADAAGKFAMWLPNPTWRFDAPAHGQLTARCDLHDASVSLVLLDQLRSEDLLETAADGVERWLRLLHPDLRVASRTATTTRRTPAIRIRADYERQSPGSSQRRVADVVVFELVDGMRVACCADAPRDVLPQLTEDIACILERIELHREGFAPTAQGPLSQQEKR